MRNVAWRVLLVVSIGLMVALVPVVAAGAATETARADVAAAPNARPSHKPKPTPKATPSPTATPTPTLAPTQPPGTVVLVGAGDIASCSATGDSATAALLAGIAGTVFTAGDDAYDSGTAAEFTNCYGPTWGHELGRTKPVPGNHEYVTSGASGYYGYFGAAAGDPAKGYYAYNLGAWRIYALNSNCSAIGGCGAGSAEETWLRADLAGNPTACVLAYWHHPRFSSGEHGSDATFQAFWQALYDFNAEIVVVGHDHDYERFAPQTPTGAADSARGILEIVAGTGGRSHYAFTTIRANSLVRNGDTFGVLKLSLSAGSYTFNFIPEAGKSFTDSGSGTCH
jgi:hypothetical protein